MKAQVLTVLMLFASLVTVSFGSDSEGRKLNRVA